ncbi:hypothetical protein [Streptomyces sp. NPDC050534]|uniref:hypothetical protein n=1 Tax=Streptomyces sp. NPDC050534 TaxID=3365625 RepID=UPI0037BB9771
MAASGSSTTCRAQRAAAARSPTLLDPEAHSGATYSLTGPQALAFREVADTIASVSGRPGFDNDIDQEAWINGALAAGVPADYTIMLLWFTGAIVTGNGSTPTGDIETVTGRAATTFRKFAERNARAWTLEAS